MRRHHIPTASRLTLLALLLTAALTAGCQGQRGDLPTIRTEAPFRTDGSLSFVRPSGDTVATIDIEIAETDEARHRGMMGRRSLPAQSGMLFIMDDVDTSGFWMRNTPLPLDIIFVAPDSQIINIAERTTPYSDDVIYPEAPKKYVVEVRAGYSDRLGLDDSTRIRWTRTP